MLHEASLVRVEPGSLLVDFLINSIGQVGLTWEIISWKLQ